MVYESFELMDSCYTRSVHNICLRISVCVHCGVCMPAQLVHRMGCVALGSDSGCKLSSSRVNYYQKGSSNGKGRVICQHGMNDVLLLARRT